MSKDVRRGFDPNDLKAFGKEGLDLLSYAAEDLAFLLNRDYKIKGASTFVGNHYRLSERQRLAAVRAVSSEKDLRLRKAKEVHGDLEEVNIDGFNTVITLEVALSGSLLVKGMDGAIRDLAGLRGNYRIIDRTRIAIGLLLEALDKKEIKRANIFLDAPVSNSGRLKQIIEEVGRGYNVKLNISVIHSVDSMLSNLSGVVTSDAIILNQCQSWINIVGWIIENKIPDCWCIDFCSRQD